MSYTHHAPVRATNESNPFGYARVFPRAANRETLVGNIAHFTPTVDGERSFLIYADVPLTRRCIIAPMRMGNDYVVQSMRGEGGDPTVELDAAFPDDYATVTLNKNGKYIASIVKLSDEITLSPQASAGAARATTATAAADTAAAAGGVAAASNAAFQSKGKGAQHQPQLTSALRGAAMAASNAAFKSVGSPEDDKYEMNRKKLKKAGRFSDTGLQKAKQNGPHSSERAAAEAATMAAAMRAATETSAVTGLGGGVGKVKTRTYGEPSSLAVLGVRWGGKPSSLRALCVRKSENYPPCVEREREKKGRMLTKGVDGEEEGGAC